MPNFATNAKPVHHLTEKTAKFKWSVQCLEAFAELKLCLTTVPILSLPDFTKQFILDTDASESSIGAVLSQKAVQGFRVCHCVCQESIEQTKAALLCYEKGTSCCCELH